MSISLSTIETRIKSYETSVANALANFHRLNGALTELKNVLELATPAIEAVDPAASPALNAADSVLTAVDTAMQNASSTTGIPSSE